MILMTNGNTTVIAEMREIVRQGKSLDVETRDRLLFTAIIDIYERLEAFVPAQNFYKAAIWVLSAVVLALIGTMFR